MAILVFDLHHFGLWRTGERFGLYLPEGTKPTEDDCHRLESTILAER